MNEFFNLREANPEDVKRLNAMATCKAIDPRDFPNWEAVLLDPEKDPCSVLRAQLQKRNDCQGQSLCNGTEKRDWYCTGVMRQRSDSYAYNASEFLDTGGVGRDQGTSITAGVELLVSGIPKLGVNPGIPFEDDWKYTDYLRSTPQFSKAARNVELQESYVTEHTPAPHFEATLIAVAAGGSAHIGTRWSVKWKSLGDSREMSAAPTSGGGHATEVVWAVKINGKWYLVVWNSHGDRYYLIGEKVWNQLVDRNFEPFGGYLLMPDRAEERFLTANEIAKGTWS